MSFFWNLLYNPSLPRLPGFPSPLQPLSEIPEPQRRESLIQEQGGQLFKQAENWPTIDPRQFANMVLSSYLRKGNPFSGSRPIDSVDFWLNFLPLWMKGEAVIIPFTSLDSSTLLLLDLLNVYKELLQEINSSHTIKEKALFYQKTIRSNLEKFGKVYVPLGYIGEEGHAICCLFEKNNGTITTHLLNRGAGAEMHPLSGYSGMTAQLLYRFFPIEIKEDILFGTLGLAFFKTQLTLLTHLPDPSSPYGPPDVYDALLCIGTLKTQYTVKTHLLSCKGQTGLVCGDRSIKLLVADFFLLLDPKEKKRFFFNAKLCSLVAICSSLKKGVYRKQNLLEICTLIEKAIQELGIAGYKRKEHHLSSEEIVLCNLVLEEAYRLINEYKKQEYVPCSIPPPTRLNLENLQPLLNTLQSNLLEKNSPTLSRQPIALPQISTMTNLEEALDKTASMLLHLSSSSEKLFFTLNFLRHLPLPKGSEKDVWDDIPRDRVEKNLAHLQTIFHQLISSYSCFNGINKHRTDFFIHTHSLYIICDKLTRRIQPALNGFSPLFVFNQFPFPFQQFKCLPLGEQNRRFSEIANYFDNLKKTHPKTCFYLEPRMQIGEAIVNIQKNQKAVGPLEEQWEFLKQFIPYAKTHWEKRIEGFNEASDFKKSDDKKPSEFPFLYEADIYIAFINSSRLLPPSIQQLQELFLYCQQYLLSFEGTPCLDLLFEVKGAGIYKELIIHRINQVPDLDLFYFQKKYWESRLSEQSLPLVSLEKDNPPFFLKKPCTANEAFCWQNCPPSAEVSLARYRQLLSLSHPLLRFFLALEWIRDNIPLLDKKILQNYLESLLLAPKGIQDHFQQTPSLIQECRSVIQNGIQYYIEQTNSHQPLLFFLRLGYFLETNYLQIFPEDKESKNTIDLYRKHLLKLLEKKEISAEEQASFCYHVILTHLHESSLDRSNLERLFILYMKAKQLSSFPEELLWTEVSIYTFLYRLGACLDQQKESLGKICNYFIPNRNWEGVFPFYYTEKKDSIHLIHGIVHREGIKTRQFINPASLPLDIKRLLPPHTKQIYTQEANREIEIVSSTSDKTILRRQFIIDGEKNWYEYIPHRHFNPYQAFWKKLNAECWITTTKDYPLKLVSSITPSFSKNFVETLLSSSGKTTYMKKVLLEGETPWGNFWLQRASKLGMTPNIQLSFYIDERTNHLTSIHLDSLSLHFVEERYQNRSIFRCQEHPTYWLAEDQSLSFLPLVSSFLVLTNEKEEKALILPNQRLIFDKLPFSSSSRFDSFDNQDKEGFFSSHKSRYFLCKVEGNKIQSPSPEVNLLLLALLASHGLYQQALFYLPFCSSFSITYPNLIENLFAHYIETSPAGIAFLLRLALHIWDQKNLLIHGFSSEKKKALSPSFWNRVPDLFASYIELLGKNETGSIPSYLRLSYEEESILITVLETTVCQQSKIPLPPTLALRKKVLTSDRGVFATTLQNPFISQLPQTFIDLLQELSSSRFTHYQPYLSQAPTDPESFSSLVRFESHFTEKTFLSLFKGILLANQRKDPVDPVDLTLLFYGRTIAKENEMHRHLLALLYSARYYRVQLSESSLIDSSSLQSFYSLPLFRSGSHAIQFLLEKKPMTVRTFLSFSSTLSLFPTGKITYITLPHYNPPPSFSWPASRLIIQFSPPSLSHLQEKWDKQEFSHVIETIFAWIQKKKERLVFFQNHIETRANKLSKDNPGKIPAEILGKDHATTLARKGKTISTLSIHQHLLWALLHQDAGILKHINESLCPEDLENIRDLLLQFCQESMEIDQLKEGLAYLEKEAKKKPSVSLRKTLSVPVFYDRNKHIELFLYEFFSHKRLREDQVKLLLNIFNSNFLQTEEISHLLFTFRAGGGKTEVLIPLLHWYISKRGKVAITVVPSPLYPMVKEAQKHSLQAIFQEKLEVLEISLQGLETLEELEIIYHRLFSLSKEKKSLLITPETYHALYLKYFLALDTEDEARLRFLAPILWDFFHKAVFVVDECHHTFNPLEVTKLGIGKNQSLSQPQIILLLDCYSILLGLSPFPVFLEDKRPIEKVLGLKEDKQSALTEQNKLEVQCTLARHLLSHPFLSLAESQKKETLAFWLDKTLSPPAFFQRLSAEKEEALFLLRHFLLDIYPFITQLTNELDYGPSPKPEIEVFCPRRRKAVTETEYFNPYVKAAITIQGFFQNNLSLKQIETLIEKLQSTHVEEKEKNETLFQSWIKNPAFSLRNAKENLSTVHQTLSCHPAAIRWYLQVIVLPTITFPTHDITSTPANFSHTPHKTIFFSATPGQPALYPKAITLQEEEKFLPKVIEKLMQSPKPLVFAQENPLLLFQKMKPLFPHLQAIIDAGGAFRNYTTKTLASLFLQFVEESGLPYNGVLYYDEESGDLFFWENQKKPPLRIQGGDIAATLAEQGLEWEALHPFVFFDPKHTTGSNIVLPNPLAKALLFIGEGIDLTLLVQSAMRLRGLLAAQEIQIALPDYLCSQIASPETLLSSAKVVQWARFNQEEKDKKKYLTAAHQKITYLISSSILNKLKEHSQQPFNQIHIFARHRTGWIRNQNWRLKDALSTPQKMVSCKEALLEFAKKTYQLFKFEESWESNQLLQAQIKQAIADFTPLIPTLPLVEEAPLHQEVHIHIQEKMEIETNQVTQESQALSAILSSSPPPSLSDPLFISQMQNNSFPLDHLFETASLSATVSFTRQALHTATEGAKPLGKEYLKPISFLLLVLENNKKAVFALSQEEASFFVQELRSPLIINTLRPLNRAVLLLNSKGIVLQSRAYPQAFSSDKIASLLQEKWLLKIFLEINLLQGKILNLPLFLEEYAQKPDIEKLLKKIFSSYCLSELIEKERFERIFSIKNGMLEEKELSKKQEEKKE